MMSQNDKLDKILQDIATMKADIRTIKEDTTSLDTFIFKGNGKPSLMSRVEVIESQTKDAVWYKRLTIGAMLSLLLTLLKGTWS